MENNKGWLQTPGLLLLFTSSLAIHWQVGLLVVMTCGTIAMVSEWGPDWLGAVGFYSLVGVGFYMTPILMSVGTVFVVWMLWMTIPTS